MCKIILNLKFYFESFSNYSLKLSTDSKYHCSPLPVKVVYLDLTTYINVGI